jgi:CheY-like chemotaxis protein
MTLFLAILAQTPPSWIGPVIWPAVVVVFLVLFRGPITALLQRLGHVTVKADKTGVVVSVEAFRARQVAAGASIARAMETKSKSAGYQELADMKVIVQTVQQAVPPNEAERFSESKVLWVDDHPENNLYELRAFEAIGLQFALAGSTEEALRILRDNSIAAIISDMSRPPDPRAGYKLLDTLRARGDKTPFVIYTGSRAQEYKNETTEHGGQGCTNRPDELFTLVTRAIIRGATA